MSHWEADGKFWKVSQGCPEPVLIVSRREPALLIAENIKFFVFFQLGNDVLRLGPPPYDFLRVPLSGIHCLSRYYAIPFDRCNEKPPFGVHAHFHVYKTHCFIYIHRQRTSSATTGTEGSWRDDGGFSPKQFKRGTEFSAVSISVPCRF